MFNWLGFFKREGVEGVGVGAKGGGSRRQSRMWHVKPLSYVTAEGSRRRRSFSPLLREAGGAARPPSFFYSATWGPSHSRTASFWSQERRRSGGGSAMRSFRGGKGVKLNWAIERGEEVGRFLKWGGAAAGESSISLKASSIPTV